ncbi:ligand-dependent nuclear receptor-interacting factor 1 isoform X2 [Rhineura floridana]|uniref:ligand-dependent nuclear receptor-interacting factor 1 isoform X2 n=1 Tax=Rhineura floridana TaxID=261503 RepID=UPI002AC7FB6E|nr:ligand-dependent nuclear receptor-interacting factor 1 isoform X2 [Rhineura floridana]
MREGRGKGERRGLELLPPPRLGHVYRVVQTTGLDGKNLLKLLPVSKHIGNFVSLVQSPVISDNAKGKISVSGHGNLKNLFINTTTSSFVKSNELQTAIPGKLILPKPSGQMENVKVVKENPTTPASSIQSNYHSAGNSLQKDVVSVCSDKRNAEHILVNKKNNPVTVTSPVLPSGHHLQIPAHAEVKTIPAFLPPAIQQKILAAAASNASGTCEVTNAPTVIYVSPVNTVKTAAKPLQNICPKPVTEVSKPLVLTVAQTAANSSALSTSDSPKNQSAPMKWVVQESPQSSASCLVSVKSSNTVASKILKTLADTKNEKDPDSFLPTYSNSLNESQAKMSSVKDNALVMYDGKVHLLTKKETSITSANKCSKQASLSAENFRKHTLQLFNSAADSTITNQVVNLVLSKSKGIASYANDPKSSENMRPYPQSELKSFKATSSSFILPHGNPQISSTSKHESVSELENIAVGMEIAQKSVTKESTNYNVLQKIISPTVAVAASQPFTMRDASKEEEQKIEKMILGIAVQVKHRKEQRRKQYLELRKKFGLYKEERVYLKRVPLSVDLTRSEAIAPSSNVQMSDSCKLPQAVPIKPGPEEEERIIEEQEEELNIKRKGKTLPILENAKRQNTGVRSMLNANLECSNFYSVMDDPTSPCKQVDSQQENPVSFLQFSQMADSDSNHCVESNEVKKISSPTLQGCGNEAPSSEGPFREHIFSFNPPDLEETIRDEKITRLKRLLREREAALEKIRKKMQQM